MVRKRTRSADDAAEVEKLATELGAVEAVSIRGRSFTVSEIIEAGLQAKVGEMASPALTRSVTRMVVSRFRVRFTDRIKSALSREATTAARLKEAEALALRLRGELSLALRAGALTEEETSYIRTICKYGVKPEEAAKMLGLDLEVINGIIAPPSKRKAFSWQRWNERRDAAAKRGRRVDLS